MCKSRQNQFVSTIVLLFFVQVLIKLFNDTIREIIKQRQSKKEDKLVSGSNPRPVDGHNVSKLDCPTQNQQVTTLVSALQV